MQETSRNGGMGRRRYTVLQMKGLYTVNILMRKKKTVVLLRR